MCREKIWFGVLFLETVLLKWKPNTIFSCNCEALIEVNAKGVNRMEVETNPEVRSLAMEIIKHYAPSHCESKNLNDFVVQKIYINEARSNYLPILVRIKLTSTNDAYVDVGRVGAVHVHCQDQQKTCPSNAHEDESVVGEFLCIVWGKRAWGDCLENKILRFEALYLVPKDRESNVGFRTKQE